MYPEERAILTYLKPIKDFVTHQEVAKAVGGKKRFKQNPHWCKPILLAMVEKGAIEMSDLGHFRIKKQETGRRPVIYMSPAVVHALESSGRMFDLTAFADEKNDPAKPLPGSVPNPATAPGAPPKTEVDDEDDPPAAAAS
jgi:hypothetical protein